MKFWPYTTYRLWTPLGVDEVKSRLEKNVGAIRLFNRDGSRPYIGSISERDFEIVPVHADRSPYNILFGKLEAGLTGTTIHLRERKSILG